MEPRWDNPTRIALLDAAVDEIAERRGDVELRRVARRARVGYGSIRYWFGARDLLLEEAVEHGAPMLHGLVRGQVDDRALPAAVPLPFGALVERLCDDFENDPRPFLLASGLVALVAAEPHLERRVLRHVDRLEATVAASIALRRGASAPRADDLDRARDLFALLDGHLQRRGAGLGSTPDALRASAAAIVDRG